MLSDNKEPAISGYRALRNKFKEEGLLKVSVLNTNPQKTNSLIETSPQSDLPPHLRHAESAPTANHFHLDYQLGEFIGEGAHALVKKCRRLNDGRVFAVKTSQVEEQHLLYLRKLFNRLSPLHHPNILRHQAMYINMVDQTCHLVMDLIEHPSLREIIYAKDKHRLQDSEIRHIIEQLLSVLRFLHSRHICHRDVKSDNILYDSATGQIWLIDFGISKVTVERNVRCFMMTNTGTCEYKAPEIYEGGFYTESIDLWAVGVVLFELVERRLPFHEEYVTDTIHSIIEINYKESAAWDEMSKHAKDLMHRLLKPSSKRLTADEALKASWFIEMESTKSIKSVASQTDLNSSMDDWRADGDEPIVNEPLTPLLISRRKSKYTRHSPDTKASTPELCPRDSLEGEKLTASLNQFKLGGSRIFIS